MIASFAVFTPILVPRITIHVDGSFLLGTSMPTLCIFWRLRIVEPWAPIISECCCFGISSVCDCMVVTTTKAEKAREFRG